ncbi:Lactadherin [Mizuhopecten yessoensis]|uniref:Lactadherin n=1 Tax=Mizuhopecten yessoensis TaxID=6573 RepID=A0A210Q439_MIZYE|nr:Lactadherin [Mizuhopecten yessoensis]
MDILEKFDITNVCLTLEYLVNGPNGVENSSMTSSSNFIMAGISKCPAFLGRLHMQPYFDQHGVEYNSWCAQGTTTNEFLQVQFASQKTVVAILTQGRVQSPNFPRFSFFTKSYIVRYSLDGMMWKDVMQNTAVKLFPGNLDRDTVKINYLPSSVDANFIRVMPQGFLITMCLRIDILGCDATNNKSVSHTTNGSQMSTGYNWGYAGTITGRFPPSEVTINVTTETRLMCLSLCSQTPACLSTSYDPASHYCIGYGRTTLMGIFKPSDPSVMSADDYVTLFFNYDYASAVGFTTMLASGVSVNIPGVRMSQQNAEKTCHFWNATLLNVVLSSQVSALQIIVAGNPSLATEPGLYVGGSKAGSRYVYQSGREVPSEHWHSVEPDLRFQCVILTTSGRLATRNCSDSLYFICSLL